MNNLKNKTSNECIVLLPVVSADSYYNLFYDKKRVNTPTLLFQATIKLA